MYNPQMAAFQPENIDRTTSMLMALKKEGRLAQYMQQHKTDPYMMSLASSVNAMFDKAQPQPEAPQPKIVDQELAKMAPQPQMAQAQEQPMPEDVGIGALPAPNMQGMAGGGIVAFGDGGDVPRFQAGGSLIGQMQAQGVSALQPLADQVRQAEQAYVAAAKSGDPAAISSYGKTLSDLKAKLAGSVETQFGNASPAVMAQLTAPTAAAPAPATATAAVAPASAPSAPAAAPVAVPAPDAGGIARLGGAPRAPVAAPRAPAAPEMGFAARFKAGMGETPDFEAKRAASLATEKAGAEEGLAKLKTSLAAESEGMFKGREERVGKREAALEKSKDANTGMAFLEAGLAMMQSKGRGLAGIAEGAAVGTKQYASGIKDIRAAQEKLDDARDRMEELRQNQSSMNNKEIRAAEKGILDIVNRGNEKQLDAAEKMYGMKREDMKTALVSDIAVQQSGLDRASREKIASMPPAEIQKISLLGGGDFAKGYEIYKQEAAIPRLYEAYTKQSSDPIAGAAFQAKFPTFEVYRAGMGGGGKILDIPDASAARPR